MNSFVYVVMIEDINAPWIYGIYKSKNVAKKVEDFFKKRNPNIDCTVQCWAVFDDESLDD